MLESRESTTFTALTAAALLFGSSAAQAESRDQLLARFRAQCIGQYAHLRGKEQPDVITAHVDSCIGNNFKVHLRQVAAAPVSPKHELKLTEFTPWLAAKPRGPAEAKGAIFFMRGATPSSPEFRPAPYFFKSLSENGWDIFAGMMPRNLPALATEYVAPAAAFMMRRADELKREGYKRVILSGHSMGAWSVARSAESPAVSFDAIVLSSPNTFGPRILPMNGRSSASFPLNLTEFGPLLSKVKKPAFVILPDDRDYDPNSSGRGAIAEKTLAQANLEHVILAKPPGFSGHITAWLPVFDYAYGRCMQRFIESPNSDPCRVPPLSNDDFRSIVRLDQVAEGADKRITFGEPLVAKTYIVYSLQSESDKPNVRALKYVSATQRQSVEINATSQESVAFRNGLHCVGAKCSILVRWSNTQLLEFDPKSSNVSGWWTEQ